MGNEANKSSDKPLRKPYLREPAARRKWCRNGLIAITVVVIVIVRCYQRPYWWPIVLGVLAFIAGSVLLVWTDESKEGQSSKWRKWLRGIGLRDIWLKGIFAPIILAVGGLLTTYGWNERDNCLRDRALLVAVATEWQRNDDLIPEILLLRDIYDNDTSGHKLLTPEFLFPTAQESRDALIHSSSIHQDVILVRWLKNYYRVTDQFALALQDIRRLCSNPLATTEKKKLAMDQVFENCLIFEYFRQGHRHLGEFLDVNYNWAVQEAKTRMDMTK